MSLIFQIIDFIKRLLGLGASEPALASGGSMSSAADDSDDDHDPSKYAREQWQELQAFIQRFEASGEDMVGVDWQNPVTWWQKQIGIDDAQANGQSAEEAYRAHGFRDRDHKDRVGQYAMAKWSRLGKNDDGEDDVILDDEFTNAMLQARSGQMGAMQANALAADPSLLEPVAGVSLEQWALASASLAQLGNATPQQAAELFARVGISQAQYEQASAGWQAKMQGDTTFVIATKYGEAFQQVQQGVAAQTGLAGGSGGEPCTFEQFVEVMVAQGCWAEQGLDVSAQLQSVFGINIPEYSRWSAHWSTKMGMDVQYARRYDQLEKQFKAKYASAGLDDDLSL